MTNRSEFSANNPLISFNLLENYKLTEANIGHFVIGQLVPVSFLKNGPITSLASFGTGVKNIS
jgi:hypothetical protein